MTLATHTVTLDTTLLGIQNMRWTLTAVGPTSERPIALVDIDGDVTAFKAPRTWASTDGVLALDLYETGQAGLTPDGFRWRLVGKSKDGRTTMGPYTFQLEGDTTLEDLEALIDPGGVWTPTLLAQVLAGADRAEEAELAAENHADDAEAAAAAAAAVGTTNDAIIAGRLADKTSAAYAEINARARQATPGATAAANRAILAAALNDAAANGAPLALRGAFPLTGAIIVPSGAVTVDATEATLTQTDNLTTILELPSGSRLIGGKFVGKGTDFVDSTAVLPAAAIKLANNASDVILMNVKGTGFAGGGVRAGTGVARVKLLWCDFEGVGTAGGMTAGTSQYGGGLSIAAQGTTDLTIIGGSYKGFAQGLSVGSVDGCYVGGGVEIDGAGQHGIYFASLSNAVISGFRARAALEGIKAQISDSSAFDGNRLVIGQGVISSCGSHGIHITNTQASHTNKHRQAVVSDVSIQHAVGGTGDGLLLEDVVGASVGNIRSVGGRRGLRSLLSSRLEVNGFYAADYTNTGIYLSSVTDSSFNRFTLTDGSTGVTDPYGILVAGASSQDLSFSHGRFTKGTGGATIHVYVSAGDMTKMAFSHLVSTDAATTYGFRAASATASRMWVGNDLTGGTARFLNAPTNAAAIADTSSGVVATVEAEVNKIKARLRLAGIVNP